MDSGQKNRPTGLAEDRQEQLERVIGKMITVEARESDPSREADFANLRETLAKRKITIGEKDEVSISAPITATILAALWWGWKVFNGGHAVDEMFGPLFISILTWTAFYTYNKQAQELPLLRRKLKESAFAMRIITGELSLSPIQPNWLERRLKHVPHNLPRFGSEKWLRMMAAEFTHELTGSLPLRKRLLLPLVLFFLLTPVVTFLNFSLGWDKSISFAFLLIACTSAAMIEGYRKALESLEKDLLEEALVFELGIAIKAGSLLPLHERLRAALNLPMGNELPALGFLAAVLGGLLCILLLSFELWPLAGFFAAVCLPAFIWSSYALADLPEKFGEILAKKDPLRMLASAEEDGSLERRIRRFMRQRQKLMPELHWRPLRRQWMLGAGISAMLPIVLRLLGSPVAEAFSLSLLCLASIGPWLLALLFNESAARLIQRDELARILLEPLIPVRSESTEAPPSA